MASLVDWLNESKYSIEVVGACGLALLHGFRCLLFESGMDSGHEPYIAGLCLYPAGFPESRSVTSISLTSPYRSQSGPIG